MFPIFAACDQRALSSRWPQDAVCLGYRHRLFNRDNYSANQMDAPETQSPMVAVNVAAAPTVNSEHIDWRHGPELPRQFPMTMPQLIADCVKHFAAVSVLIEGEKTATWRDLDEWSARLAAAWATQLPVGSRCAILVGNGLPHLIAELACWRLGAIAAPVFLGFSPERISDIVRHLSPSLIVIDDSTLRTALDIRVPHYTSSEVWSLSNCGSIGSDREISASDPCLIQFTSGSTGLPRGVVLTHGNLTSQQAAFAQHWPEVGPGDRIAGYLPWHHSFGGLAERLWSLSRGVTMTIVPGGGRDRAQLLQTVRRVNPTIFMSVPKIHAVMTKENVFSAGALRWAFTAGAPLPLDIHRWYSERGIPLCEGWGLTETSPSCTLTKPSTSTSGVVGWPIAGVSVGIRQSDHHIVVRGPNVMAGYFRQPTPSINNGILDSGDLGQWSEFGLQLTGRADHQLKIGNGEKVNAAALEEALHRCPGIRHAIVAAEPELLALIELEDNYPLNTAERAVAQVNAQQKIPYFCLTEAYVLKQPMSIENTMLTASLKISRGQVIEAYRRWIIDRGARFERVL
jgi:long-subunit acyl-CoA synthetase (AMP-forming)